MKGRRVGQRHRSPRGPTTGDWYGCSAWTWSASTTILAPPKRRRLGGLSGQTTSSSSSNRRETATTTLTTEVRLKQLLLLLRQHVTLTILITWYVNVSTFASFFTRSLHQKWNRLNHFFRKKKRKKTVIPVLKLKCFRTSITSEHGTIGVSFFVQL